MSAETDKQIAVLSDRRSVVGDDRPRRSAADHLRDARRGQQAGLQRGDEDGPRPGPDPGRVVRDGLRRRAPLRTRPTPTPSCRSPACSWALDAHPRLPEPPTARRSWSPRPAASWPRSTSAATRSRGASRASSPGVLTAVLIYLLARILFKRRSIAILAGLLVAVDGMFFVQSRIAHERRLRAASSSSPRTPCSPRSGRAGGAGAGRWVVALPVVGVLLGLALASKWVGLYAIAGVGILILGRSALGPDHPDPEHDRGHGRPRQHRPDRAARSTRPTSGPNYMFVVVMVGLTLAAVLHRGPPPGRLDATTRPAWRSPGRRSSASSCSWAPWRPASPRRRTRWARSASSRSRSRFGLIVGSGIVYLDLPAGRLVRHGPAGAAAGPVRSAQPVDPAGRAAAGLAAPRLGLRDPDRLDDRHAAASCPSSST